MGAFSVRKVFLLISWSFLGLCQGQDDDLISRKARKWQDGDDPFNSIGGKQDGKFSLFLTKQEYFQLVLRICFSISLLQSLARYCGPSLPRSLVAAVPRCCGPSLLRSLLATVPRTSAIKYINTYLRPLSSLS